ncbi:hypothetical protein [Vibrio mangrovi]|uniref:DUF306 domain-containing protein n=1 Tax=Vibrio mangrovi TaxID=474394 RepID=A0A1Y6IT14_9VIBR|nr:hypothetical protein [Vibrio mangrovi]MDW6004509.1 hypothetical protein [Vibrio mangrovi]SMS00797.1 hypothetical protein VIM7927_02068 [Vibrio mangrovi]
MRYFYLLCCLLLSGFSFVTQAAGNPALLQGKWDCAASLSQPLYQLTLTTQEQYLSSQKYVTSGTLVASLPGQPIKVKYAVSGHGTWKLEGEKLILQAKQLTVENITHPEWEAMLNLKQYIPKHAGGTLDIVRLDQQQLQLKAKNLPDNIQCHRG